MGAVPDQEGPNPGPHLGFGCAGPYPILQAVERLGRVGAVLHQEQAGRAVLDQPGATLRLSRPVEDHHLHIQPVERGDVHPPIPSISAVRTPLRTRGAATRPEKRTVRTGGATSVVMMLMATTTP